MVAQFCNRISISTKVVSVCGCLFWLTNIFSPHIVLASDPNEEARIKFENAVTDLKGTGNVKARRAMRDLATPELIEQAIPAISELIEAGAITQERSQEALKIVVKKAQGVVMPQLVELVGSQNPTLSSSAIFALGELPVQYREAAVNLLAPYLHNPNIHIQQHALMALMALGPKYYYVAMSMLVPLIEHSDTNICTLAISALGDGAVSAEGVVPRLITFLDHRDTSIQEYAAIAIIKIGLRDSPRSISYLREVLERGSDTAQAWATTSLYWIGKYSPKVSIALIADGLQSDNDRVKQKTAAVVGEIGPEAKSTGPMLVEMLKSESIDNQIAAMESLYKIGSAAHEIAEAVIPFLAHENDTARNVAALVLSQMGRTVPGLVERMITFSAGQTDTTQRLVTATFGEIGKKASPAMPWLFTQLQHPNPFNRREAITTLAGVGSGRNDVVVALLESLKDTSEVVRATAAYSLGKMEAQTSKILPELIAMLEDPDSRVVRIAVNGLGEFGSLAQKAVPELTKLLQHESAIVRARAALALIKITKKKAPGMPILMACVKDQDTIVRNIAAYGFGELGQNALDALPDIVPLIKDPDPDVRYNTVVALGRIGKMGILSRFGLASADRYSNYITSWLKHALKDENPDVVKAAVWALWDVTGQNYDPKTGQPRYTPRTMVDLSAINTIIQTNMILYGNPSGITK